MSFASLHAQELRLGLKLMAIVSMRMLGLFLVLPVFMVMATDIPGYTPAAAGVAIGAYGLTQALLQQPLGRLSDRWGRRRVMMLGLAVFAVGGVLAGLAPSMGWIIAGRALQGCGAIAGVTLAFAADSTRPEKRSTIMALIGMGIGSSFLLSILLSVPLASLVGLRGLFWLTSLLGLAGIVLLAGMSDTQNESSPGLQEAGEIAGIWPLAISVFWLHALMTLFFVVLPGSLIERHGIELSRHWQVYVPTMIVSAVAVFPLLRRLSAKGKESGALGWAFGGMAGAMAVFALPIHMAALLAGATVFFLSFNLLEATMPALVSRLTGAKGRGRKMGVYTTFQFLGAFAGGACGGWLLQQFGSETTLWTAAVAAAGWGLLMGILGRRNEARI